MPQRWLERIGWGEENRRRRQRIAQYFDCTWSSEWREEQSRISSLSPTGCYIESRFSVPADGSVISDLKISLSTETVFLQGTVIDPTPGIGFAVRFVQLDPRTHARLKALTDARRS